ncbi:hypothetical protein [Staphylococcus xylosus]|uniref:hypothetical protein n=1 Tax=Staphylococcus xylosus TaxID=1288 RepID=UPI000D1D57A3|nr:hypothetical protein [Staphylococcus xylosus]MEB7719706.1 hypothetical protein [Staphylococcus xylosus]PTH92981.1 hypothetical protein BU108_03965 [Staphylococcus xylosus]
MSIVISFLSFILSIFALIYTNQRHQRTLLDSLDSKSGWRKTLFEIAGKDKITLDDVFKIRASIRFDTKKNAKNIFDKKTNEIIEYCDQMQEIYDVSSCKSSILAKEHREKARIYSRYLLANHWEILQLSDNEYKRYRILRGDSLGDINNYKDIRWYNKEKELENQTNKLIKDLKK